MFTVGVELDCSPSLEMCFQCPSEVAAVTMTVSPPPPPSPNMSCYICLWRLREICKLLCALP